MDNKYYHIRYALTPTYDALDKVDITDLTTRGK